MGKLLGLLGGAKFYIACGLCGLIAGSIGTWRIMSWHEQAKERTQVVKTIQVIERRSKITFDVGMKFEQARLVEGQRIEGLEREIPQHVTPQVDSAYPVPCAFVRLYNAATTGPVPDATACPDGEPSGIPFSAVAATDLANIKDCAAVKYQLAGLQDWIRQQQAVK